MLEDMRHFKPRLFSTLAVDEGRDNAYKLTLDPKSEVTIDPSLIGLPSEDSLAIANIVEREGVIAFFDWDGSWLVGHVMAQFPVTPAICDSVPGIVTPTKLRLNMPPVAYVSAPFRYWTGSLIYRVQFVASKYHRGRIRVTYFPGPTAILPAVDYTNVAHNHIIDLSETRDFSFSVGWAQANNWGSTFPVTGDYTTPASGYTTGMNVGNGYLLFDVIN